MHIEFCTELNFLEGEYAIMQTLDFCYHESVTHAGISSYGRVKYRDVGFYLWMPSLRRADDRAGASLLLRARAEPGNDAGRAAEPGTRRDNSAVALLWAAACARPEPRL